MARMPKRDKIAPLNAHIRSQAAKKRKGKRTLSDDHKRAISDGLKRHHAGKKKGKTVASKVKKIVKKVVKAVTGRTPGRSMTAKASQIREAIKALREQNKKIANSIANLDKDTRYSTRNMNRAGKMRQVISVNKKKIAKLREDLSRLKAIKSRLTEQTKTALSRRGNG